MNKLLILLAVSTLVIACSHAKPAAPASSEGTSASRPGTEKASGSEAPGSEETAIATLAGGCFWCMEKPFEKIDGISAVISGYTGGQVENPTYEQVCSGRTGHTEAVQVHFDPRRIDYADVLEIFWRQIDPTDSSGQFVDRGSQYRPGIFYHDEAQRVAAEQSKAALAGSGRFEAAIATEITELDVFYPAESYHQDFYVKDSAHYQRYRRGSGRDRYLDRVWGGDRQYEPTPSSLASARSYAKPSADELRDRLTDLQYRVTQQDATEPPFQNEYWDNKKAGIYVDVVSGEPLFASTDKFDSGTGWPSFTRPLENEHVSTERDTKLGYVRIEVRSVHGDSHLGHVFEDGPAPTGLRYCINSAALRFIATDDLEKEGYGEYRKLFPR